MMTQPLFIRALAASPSATGSYRVGVLHVHVGLGDDGLDAQQESGVAADHLGIGERAHIANVVVTVPASISYLSFMPATTPET